MRTPDKPDDLTDIVPISSWKLQRKMWRRSAKILWIQPWFLKKSSTQGDDHDHGDDDDDGPANLTWLLFEHLAKQLGSMLRLMTKVMIIIILNVAVLAIIVNILKLKLPSTIFSLKSLHDHDNLTPSYHLQLKSLRLPGNSRTLSTLS